MSFIPDTCKIKEVLILSKVSGQCLYHAKSADRQSLDETLYSAFLSAVYTFSQELGSEQLERLTMGEKELFLSKKNDYIFVLDTGEDDEEYCFSLLDMISSDFFKVLNNYNLDPHKITFQTDLNNTSFEERLFNQMVELSKRYLTKTPQELFETGFEILTSILGKSLASNVLEEAKKSSKINTVNSQENLEILYNSIEKSLAKRVNKVQAFQIMKKIKYIN